jgi:hypothetical protein
VSLENDHFLIFYRTVFVKLISIHQHLFLFLVVQVVSDILLFKLLKFEVLNKSLHLHRKMKEFKYSNNNIKLKMLSIMRKKMSSNVYASLLKVKELISFMILLILSRVLKNLFKQLNKVVHGLFLVVLQKKVVQKPKRLLNKKQN